MAMQPKLDCINATLQNYVKNDAVWKQNLERQIFDLKLFIQTKQAEEFDGALHTEIIVDLSSSTIRSTATRESIYFDATESLYEAQSAMDDGNLLKARSAIQELARSADFLGDHELRDRIRILYASLGDEIKARTIAEDVGSGVEEYIEEYEDAQALQRGKDIESAVACGERARNADELQSAIQDLCDIAGIYLQMPVAIILNAHL